MNSVLRTPPCPLLFQTLTLALACPLGLARLGLQTLTQTLTLALGARCSSSTAAAPSTTRRGPRRSTGGRSARPSSSAATTGSSRQSRAARGTRSALGCAPPSRGSLPGYTSSRQRMATPQCLRSPVTVRSGPRPRPSSADLRLVCPVPPPPRACREAAGRRGRRAQPRCDVLGHARQWWARP